MGGWEPVIGSVPRHHAGYANRQLPQKAALVIMQSTPAHSVTGDKQRAMTLRWGYAENFDRVAG
jgi:hypothetical protein